MKVTQEKNEYEESGDRKRFWVPANKMALVKYRNEVTRSIYEGAVNYIQQHNL